MRACAIDLRARRRSPAELRTPRFLRERPAGDHEAMPSLSSPSARSRERLAALRAPQPPYGVAEGSALCCSCGGDAGRASISIKGVRYVPRQR